MIATGASARLSVVGLVVLLSTACTGSSGATTGSTAGPRSSTLSTPTAATSATSATTAPRATAEVARRTTKDLAGGLLAVEDLPSGWSVDDSADGASTQRPSSSSTNPACAALNTLLNADVLTGSRAHATTSFGGGADGPFISEQIDAMGSAAAASTAVVRIRAGAKGCGAVTLRIPGQGSSTMRTSRVSPPQIDGSPYALRLTATGGALDGLEVTFLWAPVGDVVLSASFINAYPEEFDGVSTDAYAKLTEVLGVTAQTT